MGETETGDGGSGLVHSEEKGGKILKVIGLILGGIMRQMFLAMPKKVKYRYCSKIISGGIFKFKDHLAGTSKGYELCAQVPDDVKLIILNLVAISKETSMMKRKMTEIVEDMGIPTFEIHNTQQKEKGFNQ